MYRQLDNRAEEIAVIRQSSGVFSGGTISPLCTPCKSGGEQCLNFNKLS